MRSVLDGSEFLGEQCERAGVIFLSEQPPGSLRQLALDAGLRADHALHLMRWHRVLGSSWPELAEEATEKAIAVGARLLVIDTLSQFSGLLGDAENAAGAALEVLRPLQRAQEQGVATFIIRHERKTLSDIADAGRGSSAYGGAVDVMLRLQRLDASFPANFRKLTTLSRFEETPTELIISLEPDGYRVQETSIATLAAKGKAILSLLPGTEVDAKTCQDLAQAARISRSATQTILQDFVTAGLATRVGAGTRSLAYRYWRKCE